MSKAGSHWPANIEAEKSVLSASLLDDSAAFAVAGLLEPEDFLRETHRCIFLGIVSLVKRGKPVDILTLVEFLDKEGHLEDAGGKLNLLDLQDSTYSLLHVKAHLEIVMRTSMQRKLILAARRIEAMAASPQDDIAEVKAEAMRMITKAISEKGDKDSEGSSK